MKEEKLLKLIGQADDNLVMESLQKAPGSVRRRLAKWTGLAVACLALGLVWFVGGTDEPQLLSHNEPSDRSLSILAPMSFSSVLRQAEQAMTEFTLELTTYAPRYRELYQARLQTALMAGQVYDMFFWDGFPIWPASGSGLFQDFYELMGQDRDDFFTHILEAWEFDGRLYNFPLSFGFMYVGINQNLPPEFIERFSQKSSISIPQLLQIYIDLKRGHPGEFDHLNIACTGFHRYLSEGLGVVMGSFIDYNNRRSDLNNPAFVAYLENMRQMVNSQPHDGISLEDHWNFGGGPGWFAMNAEHYVFHLRFYRSQIITALFDLREPHFLNFIPISDDEGRLILEQHYNRPLGYDFTAYGFPPGVMPSPAWGNVSISASADGALAWEFIQYLLSAMVSHEVRDVIWEAHEEPETDRLNFGRFNWVTPIKRSYFRPHMEVAIRYAVDDGPGGPSMRNIYQIPFALDEREIVIQEAFARLEAFNDMPVVLMPFLPEDLFVDIVHEFMLGLTTSQQAAEEIHNRVTLWLIE